MNNSNDTNKVRRLIYRLNKYLICVVVLKQGRQLCQRMESEYYRSRYGWSSRRDAGLLHVVVILKTLTKPTDGDSLDSPMALSTSQIRDIAVYTILKRQRAISMLPIEMGFTNPLR